MKRLIPDADHNAEVTSTEPFAENRYRKYRFQHESIVLKAPESSGVYGLYSALWIFIGESDNIRAGLLEHLAGDNPCDGYVTIALRAEKQNELRSDYCGGRGHHGCLSCH